MERTTAQTSAFHHDNENQKVKASQWGYCDSKLGSMTIDDAAKYFNAPEDVNLLARTSELIYTCRETVVVLDDDPTGTQTVHDVPVLTDWKVESLQAELADGRELIYILTNTRGMPAEQAQEVNREIGSHLSMASKMSGRDVRLISRSDSTLRGHYPLEVEELQATLGLQKATQVIIPAFMEGGRYTIEDVHYVQEGKYLVPAGKTPYAEDPVFGFRSSHLVEWVEEKYLKRIVREQIKTLSIPIIRDLYARQLAQWLLNMDAKVLVVNAASYYDLEKVALAFRIAEQEGRDFIYRTAASFVKTYCAQSSIPLLGREEIKTGPHGGLVLVGSHVKRSSEQLQALLSFKAIKAIELSVTGITAGVVSPSEIGRQVTEEVSAGKDVVVYTSWDLEEGPSEDDDSHLGQEISNFLVRLVEGLDVRPGFLIAKGGITSSEIATRALKVRRALVKGQIYPGIPVWELGYETPFPGMKYIIFPGNVGEEDTLLQMVLKLSPDE